MCCSKSLSKKTARRTFKPPKRFQVDVPLQPQPPPLDPLAATNRTIPMTTTAGTKPSTSISNSTTTTTTTKPKKYIRITNLPEQTNPRRLLLFLNQAMRQANLCSFCETPVRNCLVSGSFGYLTCEAPKMAREVIQLSGIHYLGKTLSMNIIVQQGQGNDSSSSNNNKSKIKNCMLAVGTTNVTDDQLWATQTQAELDEMAKSLLQVHDRLLLLPTEHANDDKENITTTTTTTRAATTNSDNQNRRQKEEQRKLILLKAAKSIIQASSQIQHV